MTSEAWVEASEAQLEASNAWVETWLEALEAWLEASESWLEASEGWFEASEGWLGASEDLRIPGPGLRLKDSEAQPGGMDEHTDRWTDKISPIVQDKRPLRFLPGPLPKKRKVTLSLLPLL